MGNVRAELTCCSASWVLPIILRSSLTCAISCTTSPAHSTHGNAESRQREPGHSYSNEAAAPTATTECLNQPGLRRIAAAFLSSSLTTELSAGFIKACWDKKPVLCLTVMRCHVLQKWSTGQLRTNLPNQTKRNGQNELEGGTNV